MAESRASLLTLAAQIVIAYIEHNETPAGDLPGLIRDVYNTLARATTGAGSRLDVVPPVPRKAPAGASIFGDHLICQECGLHMKMLKRHIETVHNATPAEYRAKWNLPANYPMVAPDYAALRSSLAKESGLGRRPAARAR